MVDEPKAGSSGRWLLIIAVVILVALLLWQFGMFGTGQEDDPTYEVGVTDAGGGELIASEPDPNAVPVQVPETPMTNVPPDAENQPPAP